MGSGRQLENKQDKSLEFYLVTAVYPMSVEKYLNDLNWVIYSQ